MFGSKSTPTIKYSQQVRLPKTLENQARNNFQYIEELVQTEYCICLKCLVGKQGKLCNLTQKEVLPSVQETWKQQSQNKDCPETDGQHSFCCDKCLFSIMTTALMTCVCVCVCVCVCALAHVHATSAGDWLVKWLLCRVLYQKHWWYMWDEVSHIIINYNHDCWFLSWSLKEFESLAQSHS